MIQLHPLIIHFPVALLVSALLFALLAILIKNKQELFKELLFWNIILGTIGAVLAVITGLVAESNLVHNNAIHTIMETHELLGYIITSAFVIISVWLILRKTKMQIKEFASLTFFIALFSVLVGYTAHLGGKMVYQEGAGVIPMEMIISNQTHDHDNGENHNHDNTETKEHDDLQEHNHSSTIESEHEEHNHEH